MFDALQLRKEFPLLDGYPDLVFLDNAATTQKHQTVIEAERRFYTHQNANVHRAVYPLAAAATVAYERTREQLRAFLNARYAAEIIFTSGATAAINLVAHSFGPERLQAGDAVLVSAMEHHANLVPWQQLCRRRQARLLVAPLSPGGALDDLAFERCLTEHPVRLVALTQASNVLGTINPVRELAALAHRHGAAVLVDAAQSAAGMPIDVQDLDADFLVFSAHKMYGPTGLGVLYGKKHLLDEMPPWQTGGEMIREVSFGHTEFAPPPQKFEAGTPNLAGVAAFGAALDFLTALGRENIALHLRALRDYAAGELARIPGLTLIGRAPETTGILSFAVDGVHPHDLSTLLGEQQLCIRAGHHCAQPLLELLGLPGGTARASFAVYTAEPDVRRLAEGLLRALRILRAVP
ncbi:MAG: cysteine desulfurase [Saprospirales bacterium]|nr:cysteine desulfurase [Saprospirales bacterium]